MGQSTSRHTAGTTAAFCADSLRPANLNGRHSVDLRRRSRIRASIRASSGHHPGHVSGCTCAASACFRVLEFGIWVATTSVACSAPRGPILAWFNAAKQIRDEPKQACPCLCLARPPLLRLAYRRILVSPLSARESRLISDVHVATWRAISSCQAGSCKNLAGRPLYTKTASS
jgi:hypothetical protein